MARLITKFKYLKPNRAKNVGGYVRYIATREGVERIDDSKKHAPATMKQKELVEKILRDFPDSKDMHEYEDYIATPDMGHASEFIGRALEDNANAVMGRKTYADYIATRPRAEKFGSHGLFTDDGIHVNLDAVSEELNRHRGNVWTVILSLRREDAQRLGYDSGKRWRDMLRSQTQTLADNLKIPLSDFRWYAAFHNESHHPHVHLIAYSVKENEGYLTEQGVENLRSAFARDIFAQDLICVYEKQTGYRDELREQSRLLIAEISRQINDGEYRNPQAEELLKRLAARLSKTKGKKQYGYLKADVKAIVCEIVDEIAKDERIAKLYDLWYEQREEIIRTYTQEMPPRVPLSQNAKFKPVRNAVIREAMNLLSGNEPEKEDTEISIPEPEPSEKETERIAPRNRRSRKTMWELYEWAKLSVEEGDKKLAASLFMESAHRGNTAAKYRLGKTFLQGDGVMKDADYAVRWLEEAAEEGHEYAEYLLGKLYLQGDEVTRDSMRARTYLESAADKGNQYAAYKLGKALLTGDGLEQDISEGLRFIGIAADKGFMPAQYVYGKHLYAGDGIAKNVRKALEYLERAARQNNPNADYLAGKICEKEETVKDIQKAIAHYQAAARQENPFAEYRLGTIYLYGKDIARDEERAIEYLKLSAGHGNGYAAELLQQIEENKAQYLARRTAQAAGEGVARLFSYIGSILESKLTEDGRKITWTDKKLWEKLKEKKQAQGLKQG